MSIRVLSVRLGRPYNHSFLDDLESFFWLILWSVAARLEHGVVEPTEDALEVLGDLDQTRLTHIASLKRTLLRDCGLRNGNAMRDKLSAFENTWASDPAIVSTIISLGRFFYRIDTEQISSEQPPTLVFPYIASIILDVLGEPLPDDFSDYRNTQSLPVQY
jgi:hypothetical protein